MRVTEDEGAVLLPTKWLLGLFAALTGLAIGTGVNVIRAQEARIDQLEQHRARQEIQVLFDAQRLQGHETRLDRLEELHNGNDG